MRRMLTAALALMLSFSAFASTPWAQWQQVGRATLTWGPFEVYHSSLLTPGGKYQAQKWPQALVIDYLRSIDREELTKATEEQWQNWASTVRRKKMAGWKPLKRPGRMSVMAARSSFSPLKKAVSFTAAPPTA